MASAATMAESLPPLPPAKEVGRMVVNGWRAITGGVFEGLNVDSFFVIMFIAVVRPPPPPPQG
eukprot:SAG25_NODE_1306_length_3347_cov_2.003695_1_plen_63_part_00